MNLPHVYTCYPSWIPFPPPSPYHPSEMISKCKPMTLFSIYCSFKNYDYLLWNYNICLLSLLNLLNKCLYFKCFTLLGRPKSLFGLFCKIVWKYPNDLVGQPSIWSQGRWWLKFCTFSRLLLDIQCLLWFYVNFRIGIFLWETPLKFGRRNILISTYI